MKLSPKPFLLLLPLVVAGIVLITQATRRMIEALEGFPIAGFTTNVVTRESPTTQYGVETAIFGDRIA